jgi:NADPH2:quinone reductase
MKAVVIDESAAGRPLVYREDVPDPVPGPADLLIAVRAAALNRADLRRAATHFASSEGAKGLAVAGLELAGEVLATGSEVKGFARGDRVMAMSGGAYAERAVVDHRLAIPVPGSFDWKQAAATPITFVTAYDALLSAAQFKAGESVLVQGASTGAGMAAVQIARWKGANRIFGTASGPKLERIRDLGCTVAIDYTAENVADVVMKHTDKHGVEVVLDHVGDKAVQTNIDAAAIKARIVCVGRVAGVEATLNVDEFSRKRIHMIGVTFRTRSMDERTAVIRSFCANVLPELDRGGIGPVIDSVYPLKEAGLAQEHMRSNQHFGKIVLIP